MITAAANHRRPKQAWDKPPPPRAALFARGGVVVVAALLTACTAAPSNLLFISFDTTRRDHLSAYGYERATSPRLEALAADGALFENAIAQQNRTLPSHSSMFTGLYPHEHGSFSNEHVLTEDQTTLAEILRAQGFRTAAFVSGYTLASSWGLDQGFEVYGDDFEDMSRWGEATAAAAATWLESLAPGERFFLFVHFYDAHGPYRTPGGELTFRAEGRGRRVADIPPYQLLLDPDERPLERVNDYVDRYDTLLHYQDRLAGDLLDAIDGEETLVVVVADHGETLAERPRPFDHGSGLFEEEIRIPLLFAGPGIEPAALAHPVETVDLLPTILRLLDVSTADPPTMRGGSLVPLLAGSAAAQRATTRPTFSSSALAEPFHYDDRDYDLDPRRQIHAVRDWPWKLIVYPGRSEDYVELYDLRNDPLERSNLAASIPDERDRLLTVLTGWNPGYRDPVPLTNISDAERERLRALGYIR